MPWWCQCGRQNPKANEWCGSCGLHWSGETPASGHAGSHGGGGRHIQGNEWWDHAQQPKSPRTPRGQTPNPHQRPKNPKPRFPKQPKQPKGGGHQPNLPPPPPQLQQLPAWKAPTVPAPQAMNYQGAPQWSAAPPMPSPGQQAPPPNPTNSPSDSTLRNLLGQLKKCSDSLPADIQQLVADAAVVSDKVETKELHGAVTRLSTAKKQLTLLRNSRWQMHHAWHGFVQQASTAWQGYVKEFGEQDKSFQEQITQAKDQLKAARLHLQQSKEKAADQGEEEDVSEDDMMRDEAGREITDSLSKMEQSMDQLRQRAAASIDELTQPSKVRKLDGGGAPGGGLPGGPSGGGDDASKPGVVPTPSMTPFA